MPQTYVDVVELLVPELQRRGIFWEDYCVPGGTYREQWYEKPGQSEPLPSHPAASMIWRPPQDIDKTMANGINGLANGHADDHETDIIDPISMQI